MYRIRSVRTTDLRPGDRIVFADYLDTVTAVSGNGGVTVRVDVTRAFPNMPTRRQDVPVWFHTGIRAMHDVVVES